ncbi:MAG: pyrroline-5-carboxylate reductase [Spirochaetaceae bacterium]|jgi:pyrroline-5-carboxylate reductase|nr:pyrroline-5-carboxylate reductase [Spirochaetaceae bacterium]
MKTLNEITAGFIGAGAMGSALIRAALRVMDGRRIFITSRTAETSTRLVSELGVTRAENNASLVDRCDIVFLAVKPAQLSPVLAEIAPRCGGKILVSMAAGVTLAALRSALGGAEGGESASALIRVMPNIAAGIGEGMTALAVESGESGAEAAALVSGILAPSGKVERVDEDLFDCVTAISGCGPAYGFIFIEALADAAVSLGMPRKTAYTFAAQTLKGAASLVLESGLHPAALKDSVCSPSGATIQAVRSLEAGGFRSSVIEAALTAAQKSRAIGLQKDRWHNPHTGSVAVRRCGNVPNLGGTAQPCAP